MMANENSHENPSATTKVYTTSRFGKRLSQNQGLQRHPRTKLANFTLQFAKSGYSDESRKAKAPRDDAKYVEGGYDDGFPTTAPVMSFAANKLGLFDMGGNVWEWVEDWYSGEQKDRVLRGGSWNHYERGPLLSSLRYRYTPERRYNRYGFRVVVVPSVSGR